MIGPSERVLDAPASHSHRNGNRPVAAGYGAFLDPPVLPFQDWDLMPPQMQQEYLLEARRMSAIRRFGACLMLLCAVAHFCFPQRRVCRSSRRALRD